MKKLSLLIMMCALIIGCARVQETEAKLLSEEEQTIKIFEEVSPSVVFIKNAALQWNWFTTDIYQIPQGAGSGFVWDEKGHIITNFHVIYMADKIDVVFSDQESFPAKVVGISPDHDLAVLKIDAPKEVLKPIVTGQSENLKVGQKVLSIGNPFGLDHSLTTGVVSALGRSIESMTGRKIYDVIQTDAAINPGNSGGPLLNSSGELIGISTAIYSSSGSYAGVGFATPVDIIKRVIPQLIKYGKVKRAGLGIILVPDNIRERLGLKGAMILDIQPRSAADKAGLRSMEKDFFGEISYGDLIVDIDGKNIESNEDLLYLIDKEKRPGDKVNVRFMRNGKEYGTTAILQELKD